MGQSATCCGKLGRLEAEGKAELETDYIQFRSDALRFRYALKDLRDVKVRRDVLRWKTGAGPAQLDLGEKRAALWLAKILNPPTRLDKLGIQAGHCLHFAGVELDRSFLNEVEGNPVATPDKCDWVLLAAETRGDLRAIPTIAKRMRPTAGLWIVYPKGVEQIREIDVIEAGREAGLKDVKVMRFSDRHTALKFVVPVAARKQSV